MTFEDFMRNTEDLVDVDGYDKPNPIRDRCVDIVAGAVDAFGKFGKPEDLVRACHYIAATAYELAAVAAWNVADDHEVYQCEIPSMFGISPQAALSIIRNYNLKPIRREHRKGTKTGRPSNVFRRSEVLAAKMSHMAKKGIPS